MVKSIDIRFSCYTDFEPCNPNPCFNGGACQPSTEKRRFTCICPTHCDGKNCENCQTGMIRNIYKLFIEWA